MEQLFETVIVFVDEREAAADEREGCNENGLASSEYARVGGGFLHDRERQVG